MRLKLNWIKIKNFKGIKDFELNCGGDSIFIAGKNGTGKTTIADAWYWLWTDSDSQGASKFNALELSQAGDVIDQQDAEVEAEIWIGSVTKKLKKCYRQRWTKKRGQTKAEMTGHTTDYFWDHVPVPRKKYLAKIEELLDSQLFRALSDVHEFCGRMKPEQRRQILVDVAGSITDDAICEQFEELKDLSVLLVGKTPKELETMLKVERKKCNAQLESIPNRIDELEKSKPDVKGIDEQELEKFVKELDKKISSKKNEILAIRSGLAVSELKAELAEVNQEMAQLTDGRLELHQNQIKEAEHAATFVRPALDEVIKRQAELKGRKAELLEKWHSIKAKQFSGSLTCFACKQPLPDDQIEAQEAEFDKDKKIQLANLDEKGIKFNEQIKFYSEKEKALKSQIEGIEKTIEAHNAAIACIRDEISAKLDPLAKRQAEIETKIEKIGNDIELEIIPIEEHVGKLELERARLVKRQSDFTQIERIGQRIGQRQAELEKAAAGFEEIERRLAMLETFSREKSKFIEQNINSHFQITKWKLFELQVNHGIREICEATCEGVPYSSDLNTGSRINVGLDVIISLQHHFDMHLPVFVDNAESVTEWLEFDGMQMVKLIALPNIEKLEVINA